MCAKSRDFPEDEPVKASGANLSDEDLERLLFGEASSARAGSKGGAPGSNVEELAPGAVVRGTVIDNRGGEVVVEIDAKTLGLIEETEYDPDDDLPAVGDRIEARFVRYDRRRDLAVLSVREARREVFWEELRPGLIVEGLVTGTNKGGLTVDIKGHRAFLPVSQIELSRTEDLAPFVGQKLVCEITRVDRADENIVLSRRTILEREREETRANALAGLTEGEVLKGRVTRVNEHGAFIDLGGVEGLLHVSKIRARHQELGRAEELNPGRELEVELRRIDREQGRISLDFHRVAAEGWTTSIEGYVVGDEVTGWISRLSPTEAWISIEEGIEARMERAHLEPHAARGTIVRGRIYSIDHQARRIELRPIV